MPSLYQARCESCTHSSDIYPAEYGAVLVDKPAASPSQEVVAGAALFEPATFAEVAEEHDPQLVVLAHPLEQHVLAETGYTWTTLTWAGRYVRVRRVVCRKCGRLFSTRRLSCPTGLGCTTGCVTSLVTGIGVVIWGQSVWLGLGAGYGTAVGFWAVASLAGWVYTRVRFRERARQVEGPNQCPHCTEADFVTAEGGGPFPCTKCGEAAVRIRMAGMS